MKFPVYASLPSLGPGIPEVHRFLSFGRATLGFGRLVRPFHSVLSFRTLTASPSGLEDFHLQSIRLHLWRSIPELLVAAAILAAVEGGILPPPGVWTYFAIDEIHDRTSPSHLPNQGRSRCRVLT